VAVSSGYVSCKDIRERIVEKALSLVSGAVTFASTFSWLYADNAWWAEVLEGEV